MKIVSRCHGWMLMGMTLALSVGMIIAGTQPVSAQASLTITTTSLPAGSVGFLYGATLMATGGNPSQYSWSIVSGALPLGLSLDSATGTISGTPTTAGMSNFKVQVTFSFFPTEQTAQKDLSIRIDPGLVITTSSLPTGTVGSTYSTGLSASGGTPPYRWAVATGSLPAGLTLSGATIGGTPTAAGTSNFTLRVTDSGQPAQSKQISLSLVILPGSLIITTTSLPAATVGTPYSQTLSAGGGTAPYTWSIASGSLPPGLTLSGATISGTPSAPGTSNFTVRVADKSTPQQTVQTPFTLSVIAPLTISTTSLPAGASGIAYQQTLSATGGTPNYTWSIAAGALPLGVTLSATGTLSGIPAAAGTFHFTVLVTDQSNPQKSSQKDFVLTIGTSLSIVTQSPLPAGIVVQNYSQPLTAVGGTPPYHWVLASGQLPPGIALSDAGLVSGIPSAAGTFTATIQVSDSAGAATTRSFDLRIDDLLTITTGSLPDAAVGASYSKQLEASLQAVTWSVTSGNLPPGLALSASGLISGTPTTTGTFSFTVGVTSGTPAQTANSSFQIKVSPALTIATAAALPQGVAFTPYSAALSATGGLPPYTWSISGGALPNGLTLSTTGAISGTPTVSGDFTFTAQVADGGGGQASRGFTVSIQKGTLRITTQTLPVGIQGSAYSQQLQASGGPTPYIWTVLSGSLPSGLVLTPAGLLQGTPSTTIASATFQLLVVDSSGANDNHTFTMAVGPPTGSLSLTGVPGTIDPAQQLPIALSLSAGYPFTLSGTLNMAFASTAVIPADDPMVQFSTGGRSVTFTIPANSTTAVFPSQLMLLAGTVAGTITVTASIQNGVSAVSLASITVPSVVPKITAVSASRISGGLQVTVSGYSPERRVTEVDFGFDIRTSSGSTQRVNLAAAAESEFKDWFQSSASVPFGSTFVFQQLFGVNGDSTAIQTVTITLKNGQGSTASSRVPITAN
jgi:hypothetical protein